MAQDTIGNLFGPTPWQIQQQQYLDDEARAARMATMPAVQRGVQGMMQGGAGLARLGAQAMGLQNPAVEAARQQQEAMKGVNFQNPETMRMRANEIRATNPMIAARLEQMANTIETNMAERGKMRAETGLKEEQAKVAYQAHWDKIQKLQYALQQAKTPAEKTVVRAALQAEVNKGLSRGRMGAGEGFEQEYVEQVNLDTGAIERVPVGTPMMTKAGADLRTGGGSAKGHYEVSEQGDLYYFEGGKLISTTPGVGKPSGAFGKGRMENEVAIRTIESDNEKLKGNVSNLLQNENALAGIVGARGKAPSFPGSKASVAEAFRDQLRGQIRMMGLQAARTGGSIGQITEKEWDILADSIANIDFSKMDMATAKKQLQRVLDEGDRILANAKRLNAELFSRQGGSAIPRPSVGATQSNDGGVAIGKTPDGRTVYKLPNGKQVAR